MHLELFFFKSTSEFHLKIKLIWKSQWVSKQSKAKQNKRWKLVIPPLQSEQQQKQKAVTNKKQNKKENLKTMFLLETQHSNKILVKWK